MLTLSEVLKANKEYWFFNFYYHFDNIEEKKDIKFNTYIYEKIEKVFDDFGIEKDIKKDDAIKYILQYFINCYHIKKELQNNIKYIMFTSKLKSKKEFYRNYCNEEKLKRLLKNCI